MQLLLINPNTTEAMTGLMLGVARGVASPGVEIKAVTGRFGGRVIASRATYAIAGHAALDAYAEHGADADVVMLACFGDPGLLALKEIAHQPVVGMAEAACQEAVRLGTFGIVTGGERWGPMLREFVALIGLADRLAVVETVAPTGAEIARDPDRALELLAAACRSAAEAHGAASVILGGAGLAGLAARIQHCVPVPLIDSVAALVGAAQRLGAAPRGPPGGGAAASHLPIATVGLGAPLARVMSEPRAVRTPE